MYLLGINGSIAQGLAHPPFSVPNTNASQWIINLRSANYKWSDGSPINATDMAFSFGMMLPTGPYANLTGGFDPWGSIIGTVSSVAILNSTAIQVNCFKSCPVFPVKTYTYPVYPYHYFKQYSGDGVLHTTPIFGGPGDTAYIPVNYTAGSTTFDLQANPLSPSWNGATPTFNSITAQIFTTDSSLVNALTAGTVTAGVIQAGDVAVSTVCSWSNDKPIFKCKPNVLVY